MSKKVTLSKPDFPTVDGVELTVGEPIEIRRKLHWLSFCDPDRPTGSQFLGAVLLECFGDPGLAASECWMLGVNPGGEMLMIEVPEARVAWMREHYPLGKLLSVEDIERPIRVSAVGVVCEACKAEKGDG